MNGRYIKQEPYIDEHGMYEPVNEYVPEGFASMYRCIMTKDMFVEAYNKWIKNDSASKYACLINHKLDHTECWND